MVRLERNYRSTGHILGAASGLIAHNRSRLGKTLWTEDEQGERVRVASLWDDEEEARFVGEEIEAHQRRGGNLNDVAVLVRAGFQTRAFEERFINLGLPYRVIGGPRFYERAEIRDAIAYLRVVHQPDDDLAFERIANVPKRGLGDATLQLLRRTARDTGQSLVAASRTVCATDELRPKVRTTLLQLLRDFERWRELTTRLPPREVAETVLEESGYVRMWQEDRAPDAPGRLENLKELVHALEEFESVGGFLEHVALVMDNAADPAGDMVTLMTLHGAKGLEFDTVFLPGWEEGVFPNQRALDEGGAKALEEERRLAYVGMTRARRLLTICYAANRRVYNQWAASMPARFVAELPGGHTEFLMRQSVPEPQFSGWFDDLKAGGRGPGFQRMRAAGKAPLIEGQRARAEERTAAERAAARGRPADLPREVRLRPGARGRGQQARDRVRQGRHQEGDRQLCRPGLTARRSVSRRSGRAASRSRPRRWTCSSTRSRATRSASPRSRSPRPTAPTARSGGSSCCTRPSPTARRWRHGSRRSPNAQGLRRIDLTVAPVAATDWLARTAEGFPAQPIGRFWVHGSHIATAPPAGTVPILLDAGQAFGSGEHATTQGCLLALGRLAGRRRLRRVLDLGCGSGILAIAAAKLGAARVIAADNDPVAVAVARENATRNRVGHRIRCLTSEGYRNPLLSAFGPYDLILANILADPLCALARECARHLAPGGTAVLSGLLDRQAARRDRAPPASAPAPAPRDHDRHLDHAGDEQGAILVVEIQRTVPYEARGRRRRWPEFGLGQKLTWMTLLRFERR